MRVLITGGAGFVGANLAVALAERHADWEVVALDNLMRRGSELNLPRLREAGVEFVHGDVREPADLAAAGEFEAMVECSAEPSVLAGFADASYSVQTNLRRRLQLPRAGAGRGRLRRLPLDQPRLPRRAPARAGAGGGRDALRAGRRAAASPAPAQRASPRGSRWPGARTLYGATKLAAEHLIEEYADAFGLRAVINRCGVIAGPWQMGKVDQGVFSWWLLSHHFGRPLSYIGYGGSGKQVRDLLHVDDLVDLVDEQLGDPERWSGVVANVGGGREGSLSLLETTALCRELTGNEVPIGSEAETRPGDVPVYLSDCARLHSLTSWRPRRGPRDVLADLLDWSAAHEDELRAALGFER